MECVLRTICRCVVFGKFHDGLHITFNCEKNALVFCHARKRLSGSRSRLTVHMYRCDSSDTIYICEIRIIPHVSKYVHDSSGTQNQNHTVFCEGNDYAVHWWISAGRNYGIFQPVCSHGEFVSSCCNSWLLHGSWNLEIHFLSSEMEPKSLQGGFVSEG